MSVRKLFLRGLLLLLLLSLVGVALLMVAVRTSETWERRVSALPLVARSTLRNLRPAPALPTPLPAGVGSRQRLLEAPSATPLASPTLAAPLVDVQATGQSIESTWTPQATAMPASPTPAPSATPTPTATPLPDRVTLTGVQHDYQLWNNCGPVTIAMALSYYDLYRDQRQTAAFLKPDQDDKNVSPQQLLAYAKTQGFQGIIRMGGTMEILQRLLSNGFPVIVADWMEPEDRGGIGHYRLFTGYDAALGRFIAQDSYYGPDYALAMDAFDASWRVFNRKYVVIYRPEDEETVMALLGEAADEATMLAGALQVAREEAQANPDDAFAWFNLGTTYTHLGQHERAAEAYDEARRIGLPFRMFWYQMEPFRAYLNAGRSQEVIGLAQATLQSTGPHEELYFYQGQAHLALGQRAAALDLMRKSVDYNPNFLPAAEALAELEQETAGN